MKNHILELKLQNLMKYLKEEGDQYNIGLYICERSSDKVPDKVRCIKKPLEAWYRLQSPTFY